MDGLVEFRTEDGALVVVEGVGTRSGARLVSRGDGPAQAARTFEGALDGVRAAAAAALRVFRDGSLRPDTVEIEFGVRLSAEAGAVIAKGSAEGHLVVKLSWAPGQTPGQAAPEPAVAEPTAPEPAASEPAVPEPAVPAPAVPGQSAPGPEPADR
ncbi:CU044_2847 family protein [Streptomyces sp. Caat 7-52]|uniref:CU044_2847 family protein n=1 Tax=Streptomyces sp. Caat 7-52 TaxID=2949637 RepID=UPI0020364186|nr:CU044_2847 family protein [Streptomyces sp. Caat 7-52]